MKNKQTLEGVILEQIWDIFNEGKLPSEEFMLTATQEQNIEFLIKNYADVKYSKLEKINADELWDEYSEYIDDDIDSLSVFAGSSVINRSNFIKAINSLK